MDDLESIFYVLCYVLFSHDTSGKLVENSRIDHWFDLPHMELGDVKWCFLRGRFKQPILRYAGPEKAILFALMNKLRAFFQPRINHVEDALSAYDPGLFPAYSAEEAKGDFGRFLDYIRQAIEALAPDSPQNASVPLS